jgi:hypothetical protein
MMLVEYRSPRIRPDRGWALGSADKGRCEERSEEHGGLCTAKTHIRGLGETPSVADCMTMLLGCLKSSEVRLEYPGDDLHQVVVQGSKNKYLVTSPAYKVSQPRSRPPPQHVVRNGMS